MTDWASSYDGWNIAEVALDGEQVDLASMSTDVPPETDFIVTLIAYNTVGGFMIMDVPTLDLDETATKLFSTGEFMYIMAIVSPTMGPVDYCVDVDYRDMGMLR